MEPLQAAAPMAPKEPADVENEDVRMSGNDQGGAVGAVPAGKRNHDREGEAAPEAKEKMQTLAKDEDEIHVEAPQEAEEAVRESRARNKRRKPEPEAPHAPKENAAPPKAKKAAPKKGKKVSYQVDDPEEDEKKKVAEIAQKFIEELPALERSSSLALFLAQNRDTMAQCPNEKCRFVFERAAKPLDRTVTVVAGLQGEALPTEALRHRSDHRFRCPQCSGEFCASCKASPYHLGKTCAQVAEEKNARHCRFCKSILPKQQRNPNLHHGKRCSTCYWNFASKRGQSRTQVLCDGCPRSFCTPGCVVLSKEDLEDEDKLWFCANCDSVCAAPDCQRRAALACPEKLLACGHLCASPRNAPHLCLHPKCAPAGSITADDFCNICWTEDLGAAPVLKLDCSHIFHQHCLAERMASVVKDRVFNFGNLLCPLCRQPMIHGMLAAPLGYLAQAENTGVAQLKKDGLENAPALTDPKSPYHGKLKDYAIHLYKFFLCSGCNQPYIGGKNECGGAEAEAAVAADPNAYVCSQCVGSRCPKHGTDYMQFKCRFCCSPAVWFCFGNTHMCGPCHTHPRLGDIFNWRNTGSLDALKFVVPCKGKTTCPLGVDHPPEGQEFSFGCSECAADQNAFAAPEKKKEGEKEEIQVAKKDEGR